MACVGLRVGLRRSRRYYVKFPWLDLDHCPLNEWNCSSNITRSLRTLQFTHYRYSSAGTRPFHYFKRTSTSVPSVCHRLSISVPSLPRRFKTLRITLCRLNPDRTRAYLDVLCSSIRDSLCPLSGQHRNSRHEQRSTNSADTAVNIFQ